MAGAYGQSKSEGVTSNDSMRARGGSSDLSGPTTSSRSYPKGSSKPGNTQSAPFNPQKVAATDIYVGGV
jgi:hypothetical protein